MHLWANLSQTFCRQTLENSVSLLMYCAYGWGFVILCISLHRSHSSRCSSVEPDCVALSPVELQHQSYTCNDVFPEPTDCHAAQCPIHQRYGRFTDGLNAIISTESVWWEKTWCAITCGSLFSVCVSPKNWNRGSNHLKLLLTVTLIWYSRVTRTWLILLSATEKTQHI